MSDAIETIEKFDKNGNLVERITRVAPKPVVVHPTYPVYPAWVYPSYPSHYYQPGLYTYTTNTITC